MTSSSRKIETVLLVDDDPNIRLIIQMSIEGLTAWKISMVASGAEALESLDSAKPDLVLLDIMMPDIDGIELFQMIQQRFGSDVPVIFLTAKVQSQEIYKYKSLGAAGVIVKPFEPMELPAQIKSMLQIDS